MIVMRQYKMARLLIECVYHRWAHAHPWPFRIAVCCRRVCLPNRPRACARFVLLSRLWESSRRGTANIVAAAATAAAAAQIRAQHQR